MYKTLNGMTPNYLRSRFVYRDNVNAYRLEQIGLFTIHGNDNRHFTFNVKKYSIFA